MNNYCFTVHETGTGFNKACIKFIDKEGESMKDIRLTQMTESAG